MDLAQRYQVAVAAAADAAEDDGSLLPKLLADACVQVLPVDGAGISVTEDLRVPLGSSDAVAALAERLQTTLGEGPCLEAVKTPLPLAAGLATMAERWPAFCAELVEQTPYRSISSLPLIAPRGGGRLGALDLYLTGPEPMDTQLLFHLADSIGRPIAAMLAGSALTEDDAGVTMPVWLDNAVARSRMVVWSAVGVVMAASRLENGAALAVLRAYAYGHGTSLDDVAARLTGGALDVDDVVGVSLG
jgi:hypothetical protein